MVLLPKKLQPYLSTKLDDLLFSKKSRIIHIEFTSHCNLRCAFCNASQPGYKGIHIKKEILESVIFSIKSRHPKVVVVNGHGETTIYKDWHLYCNRLLERGYELHIISNFSKEFSEEELNTLARFKSIEISCDTPDPSLFRELRRGAELEDIRGNIQKLHRIISENCIQGPEISFSCVVSDRTVFGLKELADFGKSLGIKNFNFCNFVKYPQLKDTIQLDHITQMPLEKMIQARETIVNTFDFLRQSNIKFFFQQGLTDSLEEKITALQQTPVESDTNKEQIPPLHEEEKPEETSLHPLRYSAKIHKLETRDCLDPWNFVLIQSDSAILPCCWHQPIGFLKDEKTKLDDIVNGHLMQELRRGLLTGQLHPDCMNCPSRGLTTTDNLKKKVIRYLHPYSHLMLQRIKKNRFSKQKEIEIEYVSGWYEPERDPGAGQPEWTEWRWTEKKAGFRFYTPNLNASLIIRGLSDQEKAPGQQIVIRINGFELDRFIPPQHKFIKEYNLDAKILEGHKQSSGEIEVNPIFIPAKVIPESEDQRTLGVQIFRLSIVL